MKKIEFRYLTPEDVECRPTDTKKRGEATLLLYIDSRSVVELMDDAVGPYNWTMEFEQVGDQVVGKMGVWDEDKQLFIYRSDTGSESNVEASKGLFSDCYKRCIARWGLTDLYNTPRIKLSGLPDNYYYNDKMTMTFSVKEIEWDENRRCAKLVIIDRFGQEVFKWSKGKEPVSANIDIQMTAHKDNITILRDFCKDRIAEEPENKDDIIRFGKFYSEKAQNWEGEFKVNRLYDSWASKRRSA